VLAQVDVTSGLPVLVTATVVTAFGLGLVFTLGTDMIIGTAPPERAGAASAISETSNELGAALGIAILGSIGTAVYRSKMTGTVPAGIPPEAAEAARDTLGGAVAVSDRLPDQAGTELLNAAREAFTQALQLTAITSAVLVAGTAVLVAVLLRQAGAGSEPRSQPKP